jgi:hypothetical protein
MNSSINALPVPCPIVSSSFPSKRDTGPPHTVRPLFGVLHAAENVLHAAENVLHAAETVVHAAVRFVVSQRFLSLTSRPRVRCIRRQFGGGERTKPPQSVSPGPNFGHRPMASPPTRDTVTGFGGAPRKDLYTVNDNPGPGYYRHTKEFGATATGGLIGKDPTAGANVFSGDQFTQRGTLGPALLLTHRYGWMLACLLASVCVFVGGMGFGSGWFAGARAVVPCLLA